MRRKGLFSIVCVMLLLFAQLKVIAQTPEGSNDGNSISSPSVGMFTGTPAISIPIYTIKSGDVSLPVSISYNHNNVKPVGDEGIVGLGWSLSAGGSIWRKSRGGIDEAIMSESRIDSYVFNEDVREDLDLYNKTDETDGYLADEYFFNFLGYSGSFVIHNGTDDQGGLKYEVYSDTPFKISANYIRHFTFQEDYRDEIHFLMCYRSDYWRGNYGHASAENRGWFESFTLTAPDGTIFTFGSNVMLSEYMEDKIDIESDYNENGFPLISKWHLSSIYTPKRDRIEFEYKIISPMATLSNAKLEAINEPFKVDQYVYRYVRPVYLSAIRIGYREVMRFDYEGRFCRHSYNERTPDWAFGKAIGSTDLEVQRLSEISMIDKDQRKLYSWSFLYTDSSTERDKLKELRQVSNGKVNAKYQFEYNQNKLPVKDCVITKIDHLGFYNGLDFVNENSNDEGFDIIDYARRYGHARKADITGQYVCSDMLKSITYPQGGRIEYDFEPNEVRYTVSVGRSSFQPSVLSFHPGGVRIKTIKSFDEKNNVVGVNKFYYVDNFDIATRTGYSSGVLSYSPKYYWNMELYNKKTGKYDNVKLLTASQPHHTWLNQNGPVGYSEVAEVFENANGEVISYTVNKYTNFGYHESWDNTSHMDQMAALMFNHNYKPSGQNPSPTPFTPFTPCISKKEERGKLTSQVFYDGSGSVKFKKQIDYIMTPSNYTMWLDFYKENRGYWPSHEFVMGGLYKRYTSSCYLPEVVRNEVFEGNTSVVHTTHYEYNEGNVVNYKKTTLPSGVVYETKYRDVREFASIGVSSGDSFMIAMANKNALDLPMEVIRLRNGEVVDAEIYNYSFVNGCPIVVSLDKLEIDKPISDYKYLKRDNSSGSFRSIKDPRVKTVEMYFEHDKYGNINGTRDMRTKREIVKLWKYREVVAMIEGATYEEVAMHLGGNDIIRQDNYTMPMIESLRDKMPNAHITTYYYEPMVGLKKVVLPSGISQSYTYDSFGRQKSIIDDEGNVLKEFDYSVVNK